MATAMRRTRVKFCGMTSPRDVALAVDAGADAVGFILADSPRRLNPALLRDVAHALPPFVTGIGVVGGSSLVHADALINCGLTLQFCSEESASVCERVARGRAYIRTVHVDAQRGRQLLPPHATQYAHATWMFDTLAADRLGGTGRTFAWPVVALLARERNVIVAGGLTPENVGECVRALRPFAVDVRSGIERDGRKDPYRMRAFIRAVRDADEALAAEEQLRAAT